MQKLQLSIPEPCHENWQQMTATQQGRFCNACAKEVIDFSSMTDIQVLNYFSTLTHPKVCGRALPEQLNRPISRPDTPKKKLFWYWNYIVMFFMFFGKGNAAKAQGGIKPVMEVSPSKQIDINNALAGRVGLVSVKNDGPVITGKVTDIDGNPVSFATIKIKGIDFGVSADSNGIYSLRAYPNNILIISGAGFISIEVPVEMRKVVNVTMEYAWLGGIVVVSTDEYYGSQDFTKQVAVLKVKDEETGKPLPNVSVAISINSNTDTAFTDRKGIYKLKGFKEYEKTFIRLSAEGYEPSEFTIDANDFKDRKKEWEILLRKQKVEVVKSSLKTSTGNAPAFRIRCQSSLTIGNSPLYIVDGVVMTGGTDINPEDVEDISVLQGPVAAALFGPDGANGAIVITTRGSKEKKMQPDVFIPHYGTKRPVPTLDNPGINIQVKTINKDLIVTDDHIKIYPNPVQQGEQFNLALKLKQAGQYHLQIIDAAGRIVLQKELNIITKDITEKILADARWSSGAYYISIFDNKNKLINKRGFIVR